MKSPSIRWTTLIEITLVVFMLTAYASIVAAAWLLHDGQNKEGYSNDERKIHN